jgi:hypothetical protein
MDISGPVAATSIYLDLTQAFNRGRIRTVISSGQAVVLHRITMQSKDGDWLIREDAEACAHILAELAARGAHYRYGAPLDTRWLAGGWSSHLEYVEQGLRVRCDFVSRPPRLDAANLCRLWESAHGDVPVVGLHDLIELKKTDRERDYVIIGALAQHLDDPHAELLASRSPMRLRQLAATHPTLLAQGIPDRRLLAEIAGADEDAIAVLLDAERRDLMRANRERLAMFQRAAEAWRTAWMALPATLPRLPLAEQHRILVDAAGHTLPLTP